MNARRISCLACVIGLTLSSSINAEPVTLTIPGEGWSISFDAPPITGFKGSTSEAGFRYQGASDDGFNIPVFVETRKGEGRGHEACANHYWPLAKRNPLIDQSTVSIEKAEEFVRVSYRLRGRRQGIQFDVPNINLYFEHNGKWVDVHISKFPFEESEQGVLDGFVRSFRHAGASEQDAPTDADRPRR